MAAVTKLLLSPLPLGLRDLQLCIYVSYFFETPLTLTKGMYEDACSCLNSSENIVGIGVFVMFLFKHRKFHAENSLCLGY